MRVIQVSTQERGGGAAIAANRLHLGLKRIGVESGMLVRDKYSQDPDVRQVPLKTGLMQRGIRALRRKLHNRVRQNYMKTALETLELFSDDWAVGYEHMAPFVAGSDVVNLHWVAGLLDYTRFFKALPKTMPNVWTLHDMNVFTGGCHYTLGCNRFADGCGACPQLGSKAAQDISAQVHRRKSLALSRLDPERTRIVATSGWMQEQARKSSLFRRLQVDRIPLAIDTKMFMPRDRTVGREIFGLPQDATIILFVADSVGNHRKGFDLLQKALCDLHLDQPLVLAAIGNPVELGSGNNVVSLGRISDERIMSFAYSAADLFVFPTRAESFGQVVMEAMACGTPTVSFDVGGVPDMVRPGVTGLLAKAEDPASLREAIVAILNDKERRERMTKQCRDIAVREYGLEVQARNYQKLYEELVPK